MRDVNSYKKEGKTPAREITGNNWDEAINQITKYLDSLPKKDCSIECQYARVLSEDVKIAIKGAVYEEGDILCGFNPGLRNLECDLRSFRFKENSLDGICARLQKPIKIKVAY